MPLMNRFGRPGLIGMAARTAVVAGTAQAVTGAVARRQNARAAAQQAQAMPAPAPAAAPAAYTPVAAQAAAAPMDIVDRLQQLGELRTQGLLNDAEFEQAKAQLLGG